MLWQPPRLQCAHSPVPPAACTWTRSVFPSSSRCRPQPREVSEFLSLDILAHCRPIVPCPTRTSALHCLSMLAICHLRSTGSAPANFSLGVALPERFVGVAPAGTIFALVSTANLQSALFQVPRDGQASRLPVTTSSTQAWLDSIFTGCQASQVGTSTLAALPHIVSWPLYAHMCLLDHCFVRPPESDVLSVRSADGVACVGL